MLQGASQNTYTWAVFASFGVIFSACYLLWLYQRVFFGRATEGVSHHMSDLVPREWAAVLPLLAMMVWMGVYTQTFLPPISAQNAKILDQTKLAARPSPSEVANAR